MTPTPAATTTNVVRETDKKWLRGMLGGTSNAFAIILVSPLDVLKIRFQTQNALAKPGAPKTYDGILKGAVTIVSNEGMRGLFKGLSVSMLRELTFSSARMGLYEPIRNYLVGPGQKEIALGQKILAGLMSGAIAAAVFNPTDVLKVRFQADPARTPELRRYKSVVGAVVEIVRTEGLIAGLYKGVGTTVIRASLLTSAQMASYDESKHFLLDSLAFRDNFLTHFCASMFSGFMTSLVTNPVDVVRTRIMTEYAAPGQPRTYANPFTSLIRIFRAEGVLGLYKGFVPSYLRLGSASVVVFMLYEQLRRLAGIPTL